MVGASVYAKGWVPHTCIAVASSVRLFSRNGTDGNFRQIGVIQSFKPADSRKMDRARGVGFGDRVAEIVPAVTDVTITCTRMALYEENILESFGYHSGWNTGAVRGAVRTLAHMKNPFDINEVIVYHTYGSNPQIPGFYGGKEASASPGKYTSYWYHDCWINAWSRTIEITGNLIYMEDVTIDVTWVDDGLEPLPYQDTDVWDTHGLECQKQSWNAGMTDSTSGMLSGLQSPIQVSGGSGISKSIDPCSDSMGGASHSSMAAYGGTSDTAGFLDL